MVPRKGRLRSAEVREVLFKGRLTRGTFLSIRTLPYSGKARVAAVIKKGAVTGAVERNRVRRALYRALQVQPPPTGRSVYFVQKVPPPPLGPAFLVELQALYKKR